MDPRRPLFWRAAPWCLGLLALALYQITQTRDLLPGIPARILNSVCGLDVVPVTTHRLFLLVAGAFVRVVPGSQFFNLNLLSALFAALCVLALYRLMLQLPMRVSETVPHGTRLRRTGARIAAGLAALYLAMAAPFWQAATQASNLTFDLFILLACFLLVLHYGRTQAGKPWLLGAAFLYGVGITEFATMIPLAPLFAVAALVALLRRGHLNTANILQAVGAGCAGLLFYIAAPLALAQTPDYGYGQYGDFWTVLVDGWRKQVRQINASIPRVGGLLILLTTFVPWFYVAFMTKPRRGAHAMATLSANVSLLLLPVLGGALLMETRISPFQVMGEAPVIVPYVSVAAWLGYIGGYGYVLLRSETVSPRFGSRLTAATGVTTLAICAVVPVATAVVTLPRFHARTGHSLTHMAKNVLESCKECAVLVSSVPSLNDLLRYLVWQSDSAREVISLELLDRGYYRNYLAARFPAADANPTEPRASEALLANLVRELPRGLDDAAFLHPEPVWALGWQAMPNGLVVFPAESIEAADPRRVYTRNKRLFEEVFQANIDEVRSPGPRGRWAPLIRRNYSRCANNVGTTLRLLGSHEEARWAYELARDILPDNPSALLNLRALYLWEARRAEPGSPAFEEATRKAKEALNQAHQVSNKLGPVYQNPMMMAAQFGQVYSANAYLWFARHYRRAGRPRLEATALEQARLVNPDNPAVGASAAVMHLRQGEFEKAAEQYRRVLERDSANVAAHIGLAIIAHAQGQTEEAIARLEAPRVERNGQVLAALAFLYTEQDDLQKARELLALAKAAEPDDEQSLSFMAIVAFRAGAHNDAARFAKQARAALPDNLTLMRILHAVAMARGAHAEALAVLYDLADRYPENLEILEEIVDLNMRLKKAEEAAHTARAVLDIDPDNYTAHLALSELAGLRGDYETQETHLRIAVKNEDSPLYPRLLNNLAYALARQDRFEEALSIAEEALEHEPSNDKFHHTIAAVYQGLERFEKAEEHVLLATTFAPRDPNHALLHAEILFATGRTDEARTVVTQAMPNLQGSWRARGQRLLERLPDAV